MLTCTKGQLISIPCATGLLFKEITEGLGLGLLAYTVYFVLFSPNLFERALMGGHYLSQLMIVSMLLLLSAQISNRRKALLFLLLPALFITIHEVLWNVVYILYFRPTVAPPFGWFIFYPIFCVIAGVSIALIDKITGIKPVLYAMMVLVSYNLLYFTLFGARLSVNIFSPEPYRYLNDVIANNYEIVEVLVTFSSFIYTAWLRLRDGHNNIHTDVVS